jgi:hypothetical protein
MEKSRDMTEHHVEITSTSPAPNSEVKFRIDCSNVTFTDLAVINPPQGGFWQYSPEYNSYYG